MGKWPDPVRPKASNEGRTPQKSFSGAFDV